VRSIVVVNIDKLGFHDDFEALTKWQSTKLQGKYINCELRVMDEARTNEKHHVLMVEWPYLAIVGGCGAWFVKSDFCVESALLRTNFGSNPTMLTSLTTAYVCPLQKGIIELYTQWYVHITQCDNGLLVKEFLISSLTTR
jgi:hypothetical protein